MTRIKICCISSFEEAALAIKSGASAIGLVSEMPSGPGVIEDALIAEIADLIPPGVSSFLLTSKQDVDSIIEQQRFCRVNTLQLCDSLETGSHQDLKKALPGIKIIQVIHVSNEQSVQEAIKLAPCVDGLLLDSGNQKLPVKQLGGTGQIHDWQLSKRIVAAVKVPVYLAGGLKPANVFDAIRKVRPFGVDVCSGIRTEDKLDPIKLKQFCAEIRAAEFN